MTATPEDPRPRRTSASVRVAVGTTEPVREVCPYLEAAEGGWRRVQPLRDHRCMATSPASPLALSKQRELCLLPAHFGCATYQAARHIASEGSASADGGLWPETRGAVLSLEPARATRATVSRLAGRGTGQALLVGLMVVAFVLLVITRVSAPGSGGPSSVGAGAVASLVPQASTTPTPSPSGTPAATSSPSAE